jgi:hypothetical protein
MQTNQIARIGLEEMEYSPAPEKAILPVGARTEQREALLRELSMYHSPFDHRSPHRLIFAVLVVVLAMTTTTAHHPSIALAVELLVSAVGAALFFSRIRERKRMLAIEIDAFLKEAEAVDTGMILKLRNNPYVPKLATPTLSGALIQALTHASQGERVSLTAEERGELRETVVGSDIPLAVAVVSAFEYIGDADDCATVKRVASGTSRVQSERVVERAKEILPRLEQRLQQTRAGATLLRAASAPQEALLHPSSEPADSRPDLLIRPVE